MRFRIMHMSCLLLDLARCIFRWFRFSPLDLQAILHCIFSVFACIDASISEKDVAIRNRNSIVRIEPDIRTMINQIVMDNPM